MCHTPLAELLPRPFGRVQSGPRSCARHLPKFDAGHQGFSLQTASSGKGGGSRSLASSCRSRCSGSFAKPCGRIDTVRSTCRERAALFIDYKLWAVRFVHPQGGFLTCWAMSAKSMSSIQAILELCVVNPPWTVSVQEIIHAQMDCMFEWVIRMLGAFLIWFVSFFCTATAWIGIFRSD